VREGGPVSRGGDRLLKPYGESSPMGLLWTFMGYSTGYNLFTGGAEALGGLLGKVANDQVSIRFTRSDLSKFQLVNRGFHWISERPFNR
jgi:hypothetical protein